MPPSRRPSSSAYEILRTLEQVQSRAGTFMYTYCTRILENKATSLAVGKLVRPDCGGGWSFVPRDSVAAVHGSLRISACCVLLSLACASTPRSTHHDNLFDGRPLFVNGSLTLHTTHAESCSLAFHIFLIPTPSHSSPPIQSLTSVASKSVFFLASYACFPRSERGIV